MKSFSVRGSVVQMPLRPLYHPLSPPIQSTKYFAFIKSQTTLDANTQNACTKRHHFDTQHIHHSLGWRLSRTRAAAAAWICCRVLCVCVCVCLCWSVCQKSKTMDRDRCRRSVAYRRDDARARSRNPHHGVQKRETRAKYGVELNRVAGCGVPAPPSVCVCCSQEPPTLRAICCLCADDEYDYHFL